jgi:hypothetical protein
VFDSAFADVNEHFSTLVTSLFPGGTGRLSLTDPENLLDTGIEVEVRPAGRNVRRLSLLSGGERSLVALAFLFAVFRSRPSPFYLMDEVEAALDDVNLQRFLGLVHEFRGEAQLIIVSHQKRTMEAADALYGVTMAPGGSSKVVSQKVSRSGSLGADDGSAEDGAGSVAGVERVAAVRPVGDPHPMGDLVADAESVDHGEDVDEDDAYGNDAYGHDAYGNDEHGDDEHRNEALGNVIDGDDADELAEDPGPTTSEPWPAERIGTASGEPWPAERTDHSPSGTDEPAARHEPVSDASRADRGATYDAAADDATSDDEPASDEAPSAPDAASADADADDQSGGRPLPVGGHEQ